VEFCQNEKFKHRKGILSLFLEKISPNFKIFFEMGSNFNWLHFLTSGRLMLNPSQKLAMTQQQKIEKKIHWSHHIIEI
jgi:hypothetical protein